MHSAMKEPNSKGDMSYDSLYIHSWKGKLQREKQIKGGGWRRGWLQRIGNFVVWWNYLDYYLTVWNISENLKKCTLKKDESCRLVQPLWKAVWSYLNKLKKELPYDPVIPLLGIYPKGAYIHPFWNSVSKEYMHPFVHCSITYSIQDLKAAPVPISRCMYKKAMVHL